MGKLRTNLSGVDDKEDLIQNLTKSTLCVPRNKVKQKLILLPRNKKQKNGKQKRENENESN